MNELVLRNRQRVRRINVRLLRQIIQFALREAFGVVVFEMGIHFVSDKEMAGVNWKYLQHEGSTDVITFDHSTPAPTGGQTEIHGEMFICVDAAVRQARQFHTSWQSEVVRYVVHGILHLLGYDDHKPAARRKMKLEENRILRRVGQEFEIARLSKSAPNPRKHSIQDQL